MRIKSKISGFEYIVLREEGPFYIVEEWGKEITLNKKNFIIIDEDILK